MFSMALGSSVGKYAVAMCTATLVGLSYSQWQVECHEYYKKFN